MTDTAATAANTVAAVAPAPSSIADVQTLLRDQGYYDQLTTSERASLGDHWHALRQQLRQFILNWPRDDD